MTCGASGADCTMPTTGRSSVVVLKTSGRRRRCCLVRSPLIRLQIPNVSNASDVSGELGKAACCISVNESPTITAQRSPAGRATDWWVTSPPVGVCRCVFAWCFPTPCYYTCGTTYNVLFTKLPSLPRNYSPLQPLGITGMPCVGALSASMPRLLKR